VQPATRSRIALNALALRPGGRGVQTYVRELLRALPGAVDAELVAAVQADAVAELPSGIVARVHPVAAGVRRALAGLRAMPGVDLVHGLDTALPLRLRTPSVATFHDLAVFDVPWAFTRRRAAGKRFQARHAARHADALIAVSPFTAERIRARLGREATVILEAPSPDCVPARDDVVDDIRRRHRLPDRFVLHVGAVEPRKDVPGLSRACGRVGIRLVLAGEVESRETATAVDAQFLGYVPRADLAPLYGAATIVAFPSWYEGFGLPPLEAMACGAAVVVSRVASLPEILGDAAVFVTPGDADGLSAAIGDLLRDDDRRRALASAGIERAGSFSWARAATETAGVYRTLGLAV